MRIITDFTNEFFPCPKPGNRPKSPDKTGRKQPKIGLKKKSKRLTKLEKERDKELIKKGFCQYCGKYSKRLDPHEVYGGSNRKRSMKNKFVVLLCRNCHEDEEIIKELKKKFQKEFEKEHTREEFIKLIGRSFI